MGRPCKRCGLVIGHAIDCDPARDRDDARAYHDLFSGASPEEIRILSGLVRAMRGTSVHPNAPARRHFQHAAGYASDADTGADREDMRPVAMTQGGLAAWHIALALDALSKEGT